MKKAIIALLCTGLILIPAKSAAAVSGQWYMNATNTVMRGELYSTNGSRHVANASTTNVSQNGYGTIVKIYATSGGTEIPSSWRTSYGANRAWVQSTAYSPDWWGSGHSTKNSPDPYKWLSLYVG